jgi:hypothetical protein
MDKVARNPTCQDAYHAIRLKRFDPEDISQVEAEDHFVTFVLCVEGEQYRVTIRNDWRHMLKGAA